jgi:hypothetical protein
MKECQELGRNLELYLKQIDQWFYCKRMPIKKWKKGAIRKREDMKKTGRQRKEYLISRGKESRNSFRHCILLYLAESTGMNVECERVS